MSIGISPTMRLVSLCVASVVPHAQALRAGSVRMMSTAGRGVGRNGLYADVTETIGNTPIVRISDKLAPAGVEVYAKLEYFNPLSSVKDRLALAIIEDAAGEDSRGRFGKIIHFRPLKLALALGALAAAGLELSEDLRPGAHHGVALLAGVLVVKTCVSIWEARE